MDKNDWYEAGDQIRRLVQDAVDSRDFSQLGDTIAEVVNQTVDDVQWSIKKNIGNAGQRRGQSTNAQAAERIRREMEEKARGYTERKVKRKPQTETELIVPGEISGRVMKWTGYGFGSMFGLAALLVSGVVIATGAMPEAVALLLLWAVLCGASIGIGRSGSSRLKLAQRFRRYMSILGNRTFCRIEELASGVGQEGTFVRKDLKKMIRKGFFKEGYLDRLETVLITDKNTYEQYILTQEEYDRRAASAESGADQKKEGQAVQQENAGSAESDAQVSSEVRELIAEGNRYIQYVHECNERLPGEEISAKLDRLELVITRIFRETERNPEIAGDLKKMMSYYLPTMKKLLDAYCELEEQPVCGQNIAGTKKEIEDAIDTINTAFENLLDSFFEEKAWDISSDISVLETMLAQQGLTGKDFG